MKDVVAPQDVLARIPQQISFEQAASLMCAGITVFNALRHSGAGPGDTVAIHGIGGLGHLGAHDYIDSAEASAGEALTLCLPKIHPRW
ncbi:hypothetical protein [Streptomyces sp. NPDC048665]|uniref:hypothetical protein n=1 Tax=Streptomyces sp. NPDC048665 TaxID=3155490 RepID=UPI00344A3019